MHRHFIVFHKFLIAHLYLTSDKQIRECEQIGAGFVQIGSVLKGTIGTTIPEH